ncbi:ABC transporter permease [Thermus sp. LT1-2-5]|uniref:ABC transporter permease n=1 Tax=Thermus sp. LT1-2-5 TaxID=3026935 RepID=UPI0030E75196
MAPVRGILSHSLGRFALPLLTGVVGLLVLAPLGILAYQSLLTAPFFAPLKRVGLEAYRYILHDPYFFEALKNSFFIGLGMVVVAVPLGSLFAFLVTKTDLPFARFYELLLLAPVFISPIILGIGFIVAFGPSGLVSGLVEGVLGRVPWTIYTVPAIAVIAGLTHVPYVYLYVASTIQNVDASLEEAARVAGARPTWVALSVTFPLVRPALVYSAALMLLLGFELFGLPLVLGDAKGIMVITTYLYRLTAITGTSAYHLMAAVSVAIVLIAWSLVLLQRYLVGRMEGRYVAIGARGYRTERLPLGRLRFVWASLLALYLLVAVVLPVLGVVFRSLVSSWGPGVDLKEVFTLGHYVEVFKLPNLSRAVSNTLVVAALGGIVALAFYLLIALGIQRGGRYGRVLDYLAGLPRAVPGLVMGLAFLWLFLFLKPIAPLRNTLFALILAYTVVWMPYGVRLLTAALLQVGREVEEAARIVGASAVKAFLHGTLPLLRGGVLTAWFLLFIQFVREYSTGVYLLTAGTEVLGAQIVALWGTGAVDVIAALATLQVLIVSAVFLLANRLGVRPQGL